MSSTAASASRRPPEGPNGPYTPVFRNMVIEKLVSGKSAVALNIQGYANAPIRDITLRDCSFSEVARPNLLRHVKGLKLERVTFNGQPATQSGDFD